MAVLGLCCCTQTFFSCSKCRLLSSCSSRFQEVYRLQSLQYLGSAVVAHGLRCPEACGILQDQGSTECPLHCKAESQPLDRQKSTFYSVIL